MNRRINSLLESLRHELDEDLARRARVRNRVLIQRAVNEACPTRESYEGLPLPLPQLVRALAEGFWGSSPDRNLQEFVLGIAKGVQLLLGLFRDAGHKAWAALSKALGLDDLEGMSTFQKIKSISKAAAALVKKGKDALAKALKKAATTFPLSMFFCPKSKMPGLTDLVARILNKSPRIKAMLLKIKSGAVQVDKWLLKYVPHLSRALYAAIFAYVWLSVAELSWDVEGILKGFLGQISLGELLASLPESALGLLAASFGLGYGALPYVLIARLLWLVANQFLTYIPGKGLLVHWPKMGVEEPEETVPA